MSKIGMNVALGLNTQGFSQGLAKAKGEMGRFGKDIKRQNEFLGKLGMGGLGRGFGMAGGLAEGLAMGGLGGGVAAVAAPLAALAGVVALVENMNKFRREAVKAVEQFNNDLSEGKVGQLVTDTQSGFVLAASRQQAVNGPGALDTFSQGVAATKGGQNFLLGIRGAAGFASNIVGQILDDPTLLVGNAATTAGRLDWKQASAAFDIGMSQNSAQAQYFDAQLRELQGINTAMRGN